MQNKVVAFLSDFLPFRIDNGADKCESLIASIICYHFFLKIEKCVVEEEIRDKKCWLGDFLIKKDGSVGLP